MTQIDKHPQKQLIIEAILAGESLRAIGAKVVPSVHHTSLARFRAKAMMNVAATIRGRRPEYVAIKEIAAASDTTRKADVVNREADDSLRQRVNTAIDKRLNRREQWISAAEKDPDGLDHRALAGHDSNELRDLRTIAELGGLLSQPTASNVTVNAVVIMPAPQTEQEQSAAADQVIDLEVAR